MKTQTFRILAIGDIVGERGVSFVRKNLCRLRSEKRADLVIANGENTAKTNGIDLESTQILFESGVDIITTGNHVFKRRDIYDYLDGADSLLRPCNYPGECPGKGYTVQVFSGFRILVVNLLGTLFMENLASPFETMEKILRTEEGKYDFAVCDFHAEATSEKIAFAHQFDGALHVIFGTHTHVQTADLSVLPRGTAYITDLGMTGPVQSVLGIKPEVAIARFRNHMPTRYEIASGPCALCGALFGLDENGTVTETEQIRFTEESS